MPYDPLQYFLHEKTAAEGAPDTPVTTESSEGDIDPGERALAGIAASSGALTTLALPMITNAVMGRLYKKDSMQWSGPPISDAKSFRDAQDARKWAPRAKSKALGLFPIEGRHGGNLGELGGTEAGRRLLRRNEAKLIELEGVVDSFIDRHNLKRKGVRLNFRPGTTADDFLGARYEPATKRLFLPRLSKEIALHELGHAADYTSGKMGKFRAFAEPALRRGVMTALPIAMVAGDQIKEMIPGSVDDKAIAYMQDHAPEIMGATLAATSLYPEAKASFLAVDHIMRKEGPDAAKKAFKKLLPFWGSYLVGAIPAVVGMSLARKYMREARDEKAGKVDDALKGLGDLEKTSSGLEMFINAGKDLAHVGKQLGQGVVHMIQTPGRTRRILQAAKETGSSPEFVYGALGSAIPAGLGALYLYSSPGGKVIREKMDVEDHVSKKRERVFVDKTTEEWREQNPARFASLVTAGAALSGGILSKFMHDIQRVL